MRAWRRLEMFWSRLMRALSRSAPVLTAMPPSTLRLAEAK